METARQTAAVRVEAARQMRRPPTIQQVFLPGMPGMGQGPVILPAPSRGEEVEL
ncbi:MAG: hypothetical protein H5T61_15815 [Thermoflexales bacterium]|nr:hypothetical protein [Thermoflexales bacterium]